MKYISTSIANSTVMLINYIKIETLIKYVQCSHYFIEHEYMIKMIDRDGESK